MADFPEKKSIWETSGGPERVRIAVEKGGGYSMIVRRSHISGSALNNYLNGRTLRTDTAIHLAEVCGVSPQWLIFGDGFPVESAGNQGIPPTSETEQFTIPGYDVELSAGGGCLTPENDRISFSVSGNLIPTELHHRRKHLVAVTARGDSMEPVIFNGDVLIIDTDDRQISTGCVYGLRVGDQLLVKRLSVSVNGSIEVLSDNPRYRPETIDAARAATLLADGGSPSTIIGRVVWRAGAIF